MKETKGMWKKRVKMSVFTWPRAETSGRRLWKRWWAITFQNIREALWLTEQLLDSEGW